MQLSWQVFCRKNRSQLDKPKSGRWWTRCRTGQYAVDGSKTTGTKYSTTLLCTYRATQSTQWSTGEVQENKDLAHSHKAMLAKTIMWSCDCRIEKLISVSSGTRWRRSVSPVICIMLLVMKQSSTTTVPVCAKQCASGIRKKHEKWSHHTVWSHNFQKMDVCSHQKCLDHTINFWSHHQKFVHTIKFFYHTVHILFTLLRFYSHYQNFFVHTI